jgi:hypothetical protein
VKSISTTFALILLGSASLASAQSAAELNIKSRSSFSLPATTRNPFWPVGWTKPSAVPVGPQVATPQAPVQTVIRPDDFVVSSISIGALSLAVINRKAYSEGEIIPIPGAPAGKPGAQVYSIRDGEVLLRYKEQVIKAKILSR